MLKIHEKITYGLLMQGKAEEAAVFYASVFPYAAIQQITRFGEEGKELHHQEPGSVLAVNFIIVDAKFVAINGGPECTINPSISFFVVCETVDETNQIWEKLATGGKILMPIDKYPWSERYGWIQDKFGLSWEISFGKISDTGQKISPTLLFTGAQFPRAKEAIQFYTSVFPESGISGILTYGPNEEQPEGTVKHAMFQLFNQNFMAMDSSPGHNFQFNEAISVIINCDSQKEIDYFWEKLTGEGGEESYCGWLKDKFGISWQVSPDFLDEAMQDHARSARILNQVMQMRKLDYEKLKNT